MKVILADLAQVRRVALKLLLRGAPTVNGGRRQTQPALDLHHGDRLCRDLGHRLLLLGIFG